MTDLVSFVRARLDDEEAAARACDGEREWTAEHRKSLRTDAAGRWDVVSVRRDDDPWMGDYPHERVVEAYMGFPLGIERATVEHIARHDPARVLADVQAKRTIVDLHEPGHECVSNDWRDRYFEAAEDWSKPCPTLRALASVWRDHPEWREEWA